MMRHLSLALLLALSLLFAGCNSNSSSADRTDESSDSTATAEPEKPKGPQIESNRYWNDLARYFGGLTPKDGSLLKGIDDVTVRAELKQFRALFDDRWENRNEKLVSKLHGFSEREMPEAHKSDRTVFYPFAGADIHTAHALFPNANKYIMFGLEPEGLVPDPNWLDDLDRNRLGRDIQGISVMVDDILGLSFFKTRDMEKDMVNYQFNGTTPILLAFLARRGQEVGLVQPVRLTEDAKVDVIPESERYTSVREMQARDKKVTGMQIFFRADENSPWQIVEYWSTNVRDNGLAATPHFEEYLRAQKPANGYAKAASYLMHKPYFSKIRDIMLDICEVFMQDDSGMPYRAIPKDVFNVHLYGKYDRPIPLFSNLYQGDLKQLYQTDSTCKELDFGMGYSNRPHNCNIIIAKRKDAHSLVK